MVLQADEPVRLWGWARPRETVQVRFANRRVRSQADSSGRWRVELDPLEPCATGRDVEVKSASSSMRLRDVLVGQVWLASGQSNMAMRVDRCAEAGELLEQAEQPSLRMFTPPWSGGWAPLAHTRGSWRRSTADTARWFSAVAFAFGRELMERLGQPVGLINASVGGSPAEAWVDRAALLAHPKLHRIQRLIQESRQAHPQLESCGDGYFRRWHRDFKAYWREFVNWRNRPVEKRGDPPVLPADILGMGQPASLYNGMIAPLAGASIKGVLWYQGERNANSGNAYEYRHLLPTLIESWRKSWGNPLLPFHIVQLPEFDAPVAESWAVMRESMLQTWRQGSATGMAVSIGLGEAGDIHPPRKRVVAQRLARMALARTYGRNIAHSGPVLRECTRRGAVLSLAFDHADTGLEAAGPELEGFTVAGADGDFFPARARIAEGRVLVESPSVPSPVHVRYGWCNLPKPSLRNGDGLPASPFRTDTRPVVSQPNAEDKFPTTD